MSSTFDLGPYPSRHPKISAESRQVLASRFSRGSFSSSRSQVQLPRVPSKPYLQSQSSLSQMTKSSNQGLLDSTSSSEENLEKTHTQQSTSQQLPAVDGGRSAWSFLFAAFIIEALCWGFPFSFGIFQAYYSSNPSSPFVGDTRISLVGTLSAGLGYVSNPFLFPFIGRYPFYRKHMMMVGLGLCVSGCAIASFASSIHILLLSQGAMYGLGSGILYSPLLSYLNEWFVRRRGLAYGVMFGGTGLAGLVLPIMFETLLSKYGFRRTLQAWAVALFLLAAPCLYLIKGRLPSSHVHTSPRISFSFFKSPLFWVLCLSNSLQGVVYSMPSIWLPWYAGDLGLSHIQSTLILSCLNLASVFGQIGMGQACDNTNVYIPLLLSTTLSASGVFLLWGLSKSFAMLIVFSLFYGLTSQFTVLWGHLAMEIIKDDINTQLTIMGLFAAQRGIGNILSGPLSSVLLGQRDDDVTAYGAGKYQNMIIATGALLVLASLGGLGACLRKRQQ